jgi:hypothetical protein
MPDARPCRLCGKPILWVKTAAGKRMPLSLASEARRYVVDEKTGEATSTKTYLSHWADCPNAEQARRG